MLYSCTPCGNSGRQRVNSAVSYHRNPSTKQHSGRGSVDMSLSSLCTCRTWVRLRCCWWSQTAAVGDLLVTCWWTEMMTTWFHQRRPARHLHVASETSSANDTNPSLSGLTNLLRNFSDRFLFWFLPTVLTVALMLQCCVCLSSVCTECIVAKRCLLEQKLLLTAYTKSYMRNRSVMVPKWMTLTFV